MNFIARIIRYVFWVLVVSWIYSLMRRVVNQMGAAGHQPNEPVDVTAGAVSRKLVRDPVCGMHIAEGLALVERRGGEQYFFCSEECRNKFVGEPRKFAANA
jgi:YHS domain-containing protein